MKLEKRIAELPIQSKELGFTRPGPYIYELLADLNINVKTATTLIHTIEKACTLLEEGTYCNLQSQILIQFSELSWFLFSLV